MITLPLMLCLGASLELWCEPSLTHLRESEPRSTMAEDFGRIYAARGEAESFQLCVRARRGDCRNIAVQGLAADPYVPAPEIARVGFLHQPKGRWPDLLLPNDAADLPKDSLAIYWVTYRIPRGAPPGIRHGSITIDADNARRKELDVRIEIFDFGLPPVPSLKSLFPLDRGTVERRYGIANGLDSWKPFYDALAGYRIGLSLWDGGRLVQVPATNRVDTAALKAHLAYAVRRANMAAIDIGGGGHALSRFPGQDAATPRQGPLSIYVRGMTAWIDGQGWRGRGCLMLPPPPARDMWQDTAQAWCSLAGELGGTATIFAGPINPSFESAVQYWAIPQQAFRPDLAERLRTGRSLRALMPPPCVAVRTSSAGMMPGAPGHQTRGEDAADGSFYSVWTTGGVPRRTASEWIELHFEEPLRTKRIAITWADGMAASEAAIDTSFDGAQFSPATVTWENIAPATPFERPIQEASFRYENTSRILRIRLLGSRNGGPAGIAEIDPHPAPLPYRGPPQAGRAAWLSLRGVAFPSLRPEAHPIEARIAPWVAWGHGFEGLLGSAINDWPPDWQQATGETPRTWAAPENASFLLYPGKDCWLPSLRLARLRDGLEDYEYLRLLSAAAQKGAVTDPVLLRLAGRLFYRAPRNTQEQGALAAQVMAQRVRIGRALQKAAL